MHTALHYAAMVEEYVMAFNFIVLMSEDKLRFFKTIISLTNHKNPERNLSHAENFRRSLRLV
ncbi:hypothetical protein K470DRAFT_204870, partial [Piedraia hortae CBS 480.64]